MSLNDSVSASIGNGIGNGCHETIPSSSNGLSENDAEVVLQVGVQSERVVEEVVWYRTCVIEEASRLATRLDEIIDSVAQSYIVNPDVIRLLTRFIEESNEEEPTHSLNASKKEERSSELKEERNYELQWRKILDQRIADTWIVAQEEPLHELVWLDDKYTQVGRVEGICGKHLHLPTYSEEESDVMFEVLSKELIGADRLYSNGLVIKPRHAHDGMEVHVLKKKDPNLEVKLRTAIHKCSNIFDETWKRECWQLSQVPHGCVAQSLYRALNGMQEPMELKVHIFLGEVVGATLKAFPGEAWVDHTGCLKIWSEPSFKLLSEKMGRKKARRDIPPHGLEKLEGDREVNSRNAEQNLEENPVGNGKSQIDKYCEAMIALRAMLKQDWESLIVPNSRKIATAAGVEELRVDWLLGDERWGTRIGELTYQGAAFAANRIFSDAMAKGYVKMVKAIVRKDEKGIVRKEEAILVRKK